jgi:ABC-type branched-subunit amino acid transport system substrate-binding protein
LAAGGLQAILTGHAGASIYVAGVTKAGDTDSFKVKAALESIPVVETPLGQFSFTPTDHTGYHDDGVVIVAANSQLPNLGYPPVKV